MWLSGWPGAGLLCPAGFDSRDWGRAGEAAQDVLTASKLGDTLMAWDGCKMVPSLKSPSHPHKKAWAAHGEVHLHVSSSKVQEGKEIPEDKSINFSQTWL